MTGLRKKCLDLFPGRLDAALEGAGFSGPGQSHRAESGRVRCPGAESTTRRPLRPVPAPVAARNPLRGPRPAALCRLPGRRKGAAFVRTKLKNIISGGVVEKTFRPTEKCPQARIDRKDMQYLYEDGDLFYFMDTENYEQIGLNADSVGDALKFVKENEMVKVCSHNGNVFAIEPPLFVELTITDTEPGFKGDTATGATKPAVVETGATVYVPLFVEQGDVIKIDTRTGEYLSRV